MICIISSEGAICRVNTLFSHALEAIQGVDLNHQEVQEIVQEMAVQINSDTATPIGLGDADITAVNEMASAFQV